MRGVLRGNGMTRPIVDLSIYLVSDVLSDPLNPSTHSR